MDVRDLVRLDEAMERLELGPNGGLIWCMGYLAENLDWLQDRLRASGGHYFLFDCPGQVELYTHDPAMRRLTEALQKTLAMQLCAVHLIDSHHCSDPAKYIAVLMTSLATMLQLELPHVNILSKIDIAEAFGRLAFNLDYYTDVLDLSFLLEALDDNPHTARFRNLNAALVEVVEDFSLVNFIPLSVRDQDMLAAAARHVDKAGGYLYSGLFGSENDHDFAASELEASPHHLSPAALAQERYLSSRDEDTS